MKPMTRSQGFDLWACVVTTFRAISKFLPFTADHNQGRQIETPGHANLPTGHKAYTSNHSATNAHIQTQNTFQTLTSKRLHPNAHIQTLIFFTPLH